MPLPPEDVDFVRGMRLQCHAGDPVIKSGIAIYMYHCNRSMQHEYLYNADGEFLIVPQQSSLEICTEVGRFVVHPTEIVVVPRGLDSHSPNASEPKVRSLPSADFTAIASMKRPPN